MKSPGRPAIVVEVAATRGSAPRGGHLELKAISFARTMLAHRDSSRHERHYALGPSLGQCCGGAVTLSFATLDADATTHWPVTAPLFHLQLHGAGHVGRAIATLLATLDCEVDWFDQRDEEFPAATTLGSPWPAHIRRVAIDTVEAEVRHARPGAFYLVLTHEHALDLRIVDAVLKRGDFAFCGLIGSKTKRAQFARRLAERGHPPASIDRIACPIGIAGVAGKEPEVIAASVVAQLLLAARSEAAEAAVDEKVDTGDVRCRVGGQEEHR
jgi:xanthine dehydrogenase accessory factor